MNLEIRKINLINWISSTQEEDIIDKMEKIQKEKADWWDTLGDGDKKAINEGLAQLDQGKFLTRVQVRSKIEERFNFQGDCIELVSFSGNRMNPETLDL